MGKIIDGKGIASGIKEDLKLRVAALKKAGIAPKLSVILVGDDPASQVYVRNKEKGCEQLGMLSDVIRMPADTTDELLINMIHSINKDNAIHGLLVQLPLPKGLNEKRILDEISPAKDVDGLHLENMGKLFKGEKTAFVPCTPQGIMELIKSTGIDLNGKEAVVIGRSNIVGKPISILLLNANATVTMCHSKTKNLNDVVGRGDVVVAAVGRAKLVKAEAVKEGAIVIDVGMNREGGKLVGDVDFASVKDKASYITPVPGGVGPMTIAMLLKNTIISAERSLKHHLA